MERTIIESLEVQIAGLQSRISQIKKIQALKKERERRKSDREKRKEEIKKGNEKRRDAIKKSNKDLEDFFGHK